MYERRIKKLQLCFKKQGTNNMKIFLEKNNKTIIISRKFKFTSESKITRECYLSNDASALETSDSQESQ